MGQPNYQEESADPKEFPRVHEILLPPFPVAAIRRLVQIAIMLWTPHNKHLARRKSNEKASTGLFRKGHL